MYTPFTFSFSEIYTPKYQAIYLIDKFENFPKPN